MDKIDEIKGRWRAASRGPWFVMEDGFNPRYKTAPTVYATDDVLRYIAKCADYGNPAENQDGTPIRQTDNIANATFIAHAPEDIEYLLNEIQRLKKKQPAQRKEKEAT